MSTIARRFSVSLFFLLTLTWAGSALAGAGAWTPVGPGAGWGWVGSRPTITVHPGVPGAIWAGLGSGLYRSSDQGVNWRWAGGSFAAVAADPSRPGALWAAAREGFFRTEDRGVHWTRISGEEWPSVVGDEDLRSLVAGPGTLYLVTSRRLLASPDGGRTWTILQDQGEEGAIESFAMHPSAPRVLYLAVLGPQGGGLLQSLDRGHTWAPVTSLPVPPAGIEQVVAAPGAVYAVVGSDEAGILRSTDRGLTWRRILGTRERQFYGTLEIDPRAPRTLYVSGVFPGDDDSESGLWVSRNTGSTWTKAGTRSLQALRIDSVAGILYGGQERDLLRSRDGGATWALILRIPHTESSFAQIAFQPENPARRALAIGSTLYRSVNGGQSWKLAGSPPDVRDAEIDPNNPNRLIAVTSSGAHLSENAGKSWQQVDGSFLYVESLVRADAQTLIAGGAGIYRSGDNGRSWQTVLSGWPRGSDVGRWAQKIEVDPSDPSTIYALTFLAEVVEPPHDVLSDLPSILWKSTDGGRTWRRMTLNLRTFAVDPGTSRLYGVRDRQILASDDGGKSWRPIGQTPKLVHELVVDPTDPNTFYVAAYGLPLARSRDRGATWKLVSDAWLPLTLTFDPGNPRILYGADRWGVFKMMVPD